MRFTAATATGAAPPVDFALESIALGAAVTPLGGAAGSGSLERADRLVRGHGGAVDEVYEPRARGVEQTFIVRSLPASAAGGDLVLTARLSTSLLPVVRKEGGKDGVALLDPETGAQVLRYGEASAFDASGARAEVGITVADGRLSLTLDGAWVAGAALPITIDPLVGTAIAISTATTVEGATDVACSVFPSRSYVVVYEETVAATGKRRIMAARRDAVTGASLDAGGAPVVVTESASVDMRTPKVAWMGCGLDLFLVGWIHRPAAGAASIRGAIISGTSGAVTQIAAPITVSASPETDIVSFAIGGRDQSTDVNQQRWAVVYEVATTAASGNDRDVKVVRLNSLGVVQGAVGAVAVSATLVARQPAINKVAVGANGWMIAWSETEPGSVPAGFNLRTRTFSGTGTLGTTTNTPLGNAFPGIPFESVEAPTIAGPGGVSGTDPGFAVAYELVDPSGTGLRLIGAALLTPGGTISRNIFTVVTGFSYGPQTDRAPSIAASSATTGPSEHDFLLAFARTVTSTGATDIFAVRLDGFFLNPVEPIGPVTTDGKSTAPSVVTRLDTSLAQREYGIAWQTTIGAGPDQDPRLQLYTGIVPGEIDVQEQGQGITFLQNEPASGGRYFAAQALGTASQPTTIVVTNRGGGPLHLPGGATSTAAAEFIVDASRMASTLAVGQSTSFTITFRPTKTPGARSATIQIAHDAAFSALGQAVTSPFDFEVKGTGISGTPPTGISSASPQAIVVTGTGTTSTVVAPPLGSVIGASVTVSITHPDIRKLSLFLRSPAGAEILLASNVPATAGVSTANFTSTTFDDRAAVGIREPGLAAPLTGTFIPQERLSRFYGLPSQGPWTLRVADSTTSGQTGIAAPLNGVLVSWSLTVQGDPSTPAPAGVRVSEGTTAAPALAYDAPAGGARAFGPVLAGAPRTTTLAIKNDGGTALTLGAISSSSGEFVVTQPGTTSLAPGAATTFTVRFDPGATPGQRAATISIAHGGAAFPTPFLVRVSGYALAQAPTTAEFFASGAKPIDKTFGAVATSTANVTIFGEVLSVSVTGLDISHPKVDDLTVRLIGPTGTAIALTRNRGLGGPYFIGARFDDAAAIPVVTQAAPFTGLYRPEEPLSRFLGTQANGAWTLEVRIDRGTEIGSIDDFSIAVTSTLPGPATPALRVDDITSGRSVPSGAGASDARDFANRQVGTTSAPTTIRVKNIGTGALALGTPALSGPGAGEFSVSFAAGAFPATVPVGASVDFDVRFAPTSAGLKEATVSLTHNGATPSPYTFRVRGSASAAAPIAAAGAAPVAIVDQITVRSSVTLTASGFVGDADVLLDITHSNDAQLVITLVAPDGTRVTLASQDGAAGNDFSGTRFDDDAAIPVTQGLAPFFGAYRPRSPLAALLGKPIAGTWTLEVRDTSIQDVGSLDSWRLEIAPAAAAFPVLEVREGSATGAVVLSGATAAGRRAFGQQLLSSATGAQRFFVTNRGSVAATLAPLASGGANPGDFVADFSSLTTPLAPSATASFTVAFNPSATGARSAEVRFSHDAVFNTTAPFVLPVSGRGVTSFPAFPAAATLTSADLPLTVPNNSASGAVAYTRVNLAGSVADVDVAVSIQHPDVRELELYLEAPDGTRVRLFTAETFTTARISFVDTVFDDQATASITPTTAAPYTGQWKPAVPLASFTGRPAAGVWALRVLDRANALNVPQQLTRFDLMITTTSTAQRRIEPAEGGVVSVTSTARDLGNAKVGGGAQQAATWTISNPSLATVNVASIGLSGANAGEFSLGTSQGLPAALAPGATMTATVSFAPTSLGRKVAQLTIAHDGNAGPASPLLVSLTASAWEDAHVFASADVPRPIADFVLTRSTLAVGTSAGILDVNVRVNLTHSRVTDLDLTLVAPDGTRVPLKSSLQNGGTQSIDGGASADLAGTSFDDEASLTSATTFGSMPAALASAPFHAFMKPASPLSALFGKDTAGVWALEVLDQAGNADQGTLLGWSLDVGHAAGLFSTIEARDRGAAGPTFASGAAAGGERSFGPQVVGSTSPSGTIVIRNGGGGPLALSLPGTPITGANASDFSITAAPAATVPALGQTTLQFAFTPGGTGARSAVISLVHDGRGTATPFLIPVSGVGVTSFAQVVTLTSPDASATTPTAVPAASDGRAVIFSSLPGFVSDVNVTVTLTPNVAGGANIRAFTVTLVGPDGAAVVVSTNRTAAYAQTTFDDTGANPPTERLSKFNGRLAAGVWTLVVRNPAVGGTIQGVSLQIATTATATPALEAREGTASGPEIASGAAPSGGRFFPPTQRGTVQPVALEVVVRNPGGAPLTISSATVSAADFAVVAPATIPAGGAGSVTVTYQPVAAGKHAGTVTLSTNATASLPSGTFTFGVQGRALRAPVLHLTAAATSTAIPDNDATTGAFVDIAHSTTERIVDVIPRFQLDHRNVGDLRLDLIAPDGTDLRIAWPGGSGITVFSFSLGTLPYFMDDLGDAPPSGTVANSYFAPNDPLAGLYGRIAGGTWRLRAADIQSPSTGRITDFELYLATAPAFPQIVVRDGGGAAIANGAAASGRRIMGAQDVSGGAATPLDIVVQNTGPGTLDLSSVQATGAFSIQPPGFTAAVPPGGQATFQVLFDPPSAGAFTGTVSVAHDDAFSTATPFTFGVAGDGVITVPPTTTAVIPAPLAIPDNAPAGLRSEVLVNAPGFVASVRVLGLSISHGNTQHLDLSLVSPDGTRVELSTDNGAGALAGGGYLGTSFDDAAPVSILAAAVPFAGTFRPEQPLAAFQGRRAAGVWTLLAVDDTSGTAGTLAGWSLEVTTQASAPAILDVRDGAGLLASGGTHAFTFRGVSDGPSAAETITLVNAGGATIDLGRPVKSGPSAADFILDASAFGASTPLLSGQSIAFTVAFDPASPGAKLADITFDHTAPGAASPFVLHVSGQGLIAPPRTFVATGLPLGISDPPSSSTTVTTTSTIVIPAPPVGAIGVIDVNVTVTITHPQDDNLDIFLVSPAGTRVELTTDNGGSGRDYTGTTFDDEAGTAITAGAPPFSGSFRPERPLSAFFGESAVGAWTLEITDDALGQSGTLVGWSLEIQSSPTPISRPVLREDTTTGAAIPNGTGAPVYCGVAVGALPTLKRVHVLNAGLGTLTMQRPSIEGANPSDFDVVGTFPLVVAAGASASFDIALSPAATGPVSATASLDHDGTAFTASPYRFDIQGRRTELAPLAAAATSTPVPVPDATAAGPGRADVPLAVQGDGKIEYVVAAISIAHGNAADLDVTLVHPGGAVVTLTSDNGGAGAGYTGTILDDIAAAEVALAATPFTGRFRPEGALGSLAGLRADGAWTLRVEDDATSVTGTVTSASIEVGLERSPLLEVRAGSASGPVLAHDAAPGGLLDFGGLDLRLSPSVPLSIVIRNAGTLPLAVPAVTLASNVGGAFRLDTTGLAATVAAGGQTSFTLFFEPRALGTDTASVSIGHDDDTVAAPFLVNAVGEGVLPQIAVDVDGRAIASQGFTDFGSVAVGASKASTVTVRNPGSGTLALSRPAILAGPNANEMVLDTAGYALSVPAGGSTSFRVVFQPKLGGNKFGLVSIVHDGVNAPVPFKVDFGGTSPVSINGNTGGGSGGGSGGCTARPGAPDAGLPALFVAAALALLARARRRARRAA